MRCTMLVESNTCFGGKDYIHFHNLVYIQVVMIRITEDDTILSNAQAVDADAGTYIPQ